MKTLHTIYMIVSPIVIVALVVLVVIYWKQKQDCEKKENLCLCNGPQMVGHCKPYNQWGNMQIGVNTPRKNKGPPPLNMPYDVVQHGYTRIRPDCF